MSQDNKSSAVTDGAATSLSTRRRIRRWMLRGRRLSRSVIGFDDTPHRIALGVAIGFFVAWTPTIPFQMALTFLISFLLGANKVVGQPAVWITNPVTAVPLYWFNFKVGCFILHIDCASQQFVGALKEIIASVDSWQDKLKASWGVSLEAMAPLWVGSLVVGGILAILAYVLCYRGTAAFQRRRKMRKERKRSEAIVAH